MIRIYQRYMAWRRGMSDRVNAKRHDLMLARMDARNKANQQREDSSNKGLGLSTVIGAIIGLVIGGEIADGMDG